MQVDEADKVQEGVEGAFDSSSQPLGLEGEYGPWLKPWGRCNLT